MLIECISDECFVFLDLSALKTLLILFIFLITEEFKETNVYLYSSTLNVILSP